MQARAVALILSATHLAEIRNSGVRVGQEAADRRMILAAVKELGLPELNHPNRGLNISYDRDTRQSIVQIVDKDSGEIVHQIPGKDVVERVKYYRELSGL